MIDDVRVDVFNPDIFFSNEADSVIYALTDGAIAERDRIMDMDVTVVYEWYYNWMVRLINKMRREIAVMVKCNQQ